MQFIKQDLFYYRMAFRYIIAPEHIIDVAKKVHDFLTVGASAPLQEAAVVGLEFGEDTIKNSRHCIHIRKIYSVMV